MPRIPLISTKRTIMSHLNPWNIITNRHGIWRWKSRSWLVTDTNRCRVNTGVKILQRLDFSRAKAHIHICNRIWNFSFTGSQYKAAFKQVNGIKSWILQHGCMVRIEIMLIFVSINLLHSTKLNIYIFILVT